MPLAQRRGAVAALLQGEPAEDGNQQHLQDFTLGKGVEHRGGHDVQQEVHHALLVRLVGIGGDARRIQRRDIHMHAMRRAPPR